MAWDDGIVGPGREFAATEAKRIRCLAGPGTGKTYALMRRVQRLIEEEGVDPKRILVVTLTRTAADDLRRCLERLGVDGASDVPATTLHSFCYTVLREDAVLQITRRHPRMLAEFERDILLKDLPDGLGNFTAKKALLTQFIAAWSSLDGLPIGTPPGSLPQVFQSQLTDALRRHECMLVDELVPIARTYLSENPYVDALDRVDHVLVDEFQDLNRADQGVIELLASAAIRRGGHIAIIGDDDQAIYVKLRHAHPSGIVDFRAQADIPLVECRRCPKRVVTMAQSLIEHNPGRTKSPLTPLPGNPEGQVHNVMFLSMAAQTEGIAQFVHSRITDGRVEPGDVLILSNWRAIAYAMRDRLRDMGHEAHSFFREEPLDSADAKRAYTKISLLAEPDDLVSIRTHLALTHEHENRAGYRRVERYAEDNSQTVLEVLDSLSDGVVSIPYTDGVVASWSGLKGELARLHALGAVRAIVDDLVPVGQDEVSRLRAVGSRPYSCGKSLT